MVRIQGLAAAETSRLRLESCQRTVDEWNVRLGESLLGTGSFQPDVNHHAGAEILLRTRPV
jgi:hypothetical protein